MPDLEVQALAGDGGVAHEVLYAAAHEYSAPLSSSDTGGKDEEVALVGGEVLKGG